ncbi:hypothetical protein FNL37_1761 [Methylovorus glucosotrophus]|uniref:hypothetical protein n=1 Tax=Methylovorus glucosotrophus TaxID=266009 RepID=UPI0013316989|nr:hypothetical protein [Methylovorus glucosotrophus]KAF0844317.1 hypothetical protein FNL37_1761 [Methylovorus glucosotrophus]
MIKWVIGFFTDKVKAYTAIAGAVALAVFVASAITYILVITNQRDKAVRELAEVKAEIRNARQNRAGEIAAIKAEDSQSRIVLANAYNDTFKRAQEYYANNPNVVYRYLADRMQQPANNSAPAGGVSGVSIPAEVFTQGRGDQDPVFTRLANDCTETTAQYDALRHAWDTYCKTHKCE